MTTVGAAIYASARPVEVRRVRTPKLLPAFIPATSPFPQSLLTPYIKGYPNNQELGGQQDGGAAYWRSPIAAKTQPSLRRTSNERIKTSCCVGLSCAPSLNVSPANALIA